MNARQLVKMCVKYLRWHWVSALWTSFVKMDMFVSHMEESDSSPGSSSRSPKSASIDNESAQLDLRRLEEIIHSHSFEPEVNAKHYNMRTVIEMTHEQLIHMSQDEIKGIFQMLCQELTTADFFSVKVGMKKNINTHDTHIGSLS